MDYAFQISLDMDAQRQALKQMEIQKKIQSSIPNIESGLGRVNAIGQKMKTPHTETKLVS